MLEYRFFDRLVGAEVSYLDPTQGNVPDCGLIAGLIATAWVDASRWKGRLEATGFAPPVKSMHRCQFFDPGMPAAVDIQPDLAVDPGGKLVYASSSETSEVWPGVLEKGYAMWRAGINFRADDPDSDNLKASKYQAIGLVFPQDAFEHLWGAQASFVDRGHNFDRLARTSGAKSLLDDNGITRFPTVAWTYETAAQSGFAGAYRLTHTGLIRNHAYAVLGVIKAPDDTPFVVLRNPYADNVVLPEDEHLPGRWRPEGLPM